MTIEAVATKTCRACGRTLALTAFTRDLARSDGYYSRCRECQLARRRQLAAERVTPSGTRVCTQCGKEKPVSFFFPGQLWCRGCKRRYAVARDRELVRGTWDDRPDPSEDPDLIRAAGDRLLAIGRARLSAELEGLPRVPAPVEGLCPRCRTRLRQSQGWWTCGACGYEWSGT
ncbi:MAG TPA: hypothetical protein VFH17_07150 [Coriobacteriia bacterium]|nr:hypothetical protein [Coriobacteriia bacterium]